MKYLAVLLLAGCVGCKEDGFEMPIEQTQSSSAAHEAGHYVFKKDTGPVVMLFGNDAESMLYHGGLGPNVVESLEAKHFSLLAFDLPCHGFDKESIPPLDCWRRRIEAGDADLFKRFCTYMSETLTDLRLDNVMVLGLSRGGYVAATCAAQDSRIRAAALLIPVTDLQMLAEFRGFTVPGSFALPSISIPTYLRIGHADGRVDTASAVAYGARIGATVVVMDTPDHDAHEEGQTAEWLMLH